jgi:hypothetical protein
MIVIISSRYVLPNHKHRHSIKCKYTQCVCMCEREKEDLIRKSHQTSVKKTAREQNLKLYIFNMWNKVKDSTLVPRETYPRNLCWIFHMRTIGFQFSAIRSFRKLQIFHHHVVPSKSSILILFDNVWIITIN